MLRDDGQVRCPGAVRRQRLQMADYGSRQSTFRKAAVVSRRSRRPMPEAGAAALVIRIFHFALEKPGPLAVRERH